MSFTAKQISDFLQGEIVGNPNVLVNDFAKIEEGKPQTISFLSNPKYTRYIYETKSDIILVDKDFTPQKEITATLIKVKNVQAALGKMLEFVNSAKPQKTGVHPLSYVSRTAKLGENVYLGAFAYIGENATIGSQTKIFPHAFIGDNVRVGENVTIYAGAKILDDCRVGDNCIIHAGAIIGADGFGFAPQPDGKYEKIPQTGNVIIEDDVEIGANTTIDRAVIGSTTIYRGVKLDNLIHIAHNVQVGENTVMAAQAGIAGSTKIGARCVIGGQVGIAGHLVVEDKVQIGAQSGILTNMKAGAKIMGSPAIPISNYFRSSLLHGRLPEIYSQLSRLEKEIKELKNNQLKNKAQ